MSGYPPGQPDLGWDHADARGSACGAWLQAQTACGSTLCMGDLPRRSKNARLWSNAPTLTTCPAADVEPT